jgi:hypothetical protein
MTNQTETKRPDFRPASSHTSTKLKSSLLPGGCRIPPSTMRSTYWNAREPPVTSTGDRGDRDYIVRKRRFIDRVTICVSTTCKRTTEPLCERIASPLALFRATAALLVRIFSRAKRIDCAKLRRQNLRRGCGRRKTYIPRMVQICSRSIATGAFRDKLRSFFQGVVGASDFMGGSIEL